MKELNFIAADDLTRHVQATIEKYGEKLTSYDLKRFNKNIVDPIKLLFDKMVYRSSWEDIIRSEIFRQRDKSNNNSIGYFHPLSMAVYLLGFGTYHGFSPVCVMGGEHLS